MLASNAIRNAAPVWDRRRRWSVRTTLAASLTVLGVLAVIAPVSLMPAMLTWFATLLLVGYVGLATVLAAAAVPVWVALSRGLDASNLLIFAVAVAVFIAFTHRSNLRTLFSGNASPDIRFSLFNRSG